MQPGKGRSRGLRWLAARALPAAAVIAALAISACGGDGDELVVEGCIPDPPPMIDDGFREPDVRVSEDGVLETTLRASYGPVTLDGEEYETLNYEGSVPGPTLVVCPGDRLIIHLENDLGGTPAAWGPTPPAHDVPHGEGQLTNLHTHGFHVSPRGNSDNVFLSIPPGESFTYEYEIPEDHPPGMYWYHPHRHGFVEAQVYGGLFGAIYVQGGLDELPDLREIPTRTMIINSLELPKDGDDLPPRAQSEASRVPAVVPAAKSDTAKSPYLVNGELQPEIEIEPGEVQRWRILNADDNAIVRLGLRGHTFYVLANDGNTLEEISPQRRLFLGPAERREVLVQGAPAGSYELESERFTQFQGGPVPAATVATLRSEGSERDDELPGPELYQQQEDLRDAQVDQRHRLVFTERQVGKNEFEFLINGKVFNADRIDQVMKLDEVNEWTLVNSTTEWHTFHIHVNDFQVVGFRGRRVPRVSSGRVEDVAPREIDLEDTVKMPPGSAVTMRTRPTDFTGKFVFHCHMLFHEDHGMMGVVRVDAD